MEPDELRRDRGRGRLSRTAEREYRELRDSTHPRRTLSPETELEISDERVALASEDERRTCFSPREHPKPPHARDEGVTDHTGSRLVDIEKDTPSVGAELSPTGRDFFEMGLPELDDLTTDVDDVANTDLSLDDLTGLGPL